MFSVFWSLSQNKIQQWAAHRQLATNKQTQFIQQTKTYMKETVSSGILFNE